MIKRTLSYINELSLFQKIVFSFLITIILPVLISYVISIDITNRLVVDGICNETLSSVEYSSLSLEKMIRKVGATVSFLYNDNNIGDLLIIDSHTGPIQNGKMKAQRINVINKVDAALQSIFTNIMEFEGYITILTSSGNYYSNYTTEGENIEKYILHYIEDNSKNPSPSVVWKGIEENYIRSLKDFFPYVITVTKSLRTQSINQSAEGLLILSIPEKEIRKNIIVKNSKNIRLILDKNMNIISSTEESWLKRPFSMIYNGLLPDKESGYFIDEINNGQKSIITYRKISNLDWIIVDLKLYSEVVGKFQETSAILVIVNIVCILIFFSFEALIAKSITKPLKQLSRAMLKTDLNVNEQITVAKNNEIGILEKNFNIMKSNILALIEENKIKEEKKRKAEIQALQAQISPHFLFNTLNSIRMASENNNNEKASAMVLALSKLLRMTIVKGEEMITISEEIENIRSYADILHFRHAKSFEVLYDIEEGIKNCLIPKLLIQPLVENSIIHGFEDNKVEGKIEIIGYEKDSKVFLEVRDNGKGVDSDVLNGCIQNKAYKFSGIGISNVQERVKLYYGEEYGLSIESSVGFGTKVVVVIPKLYREEGNHDKSYSCR